MKRAQIEKFGFCRIRSYSLFPLILFVIILACSQCQVTNDNQNSNIYPSTQIKQRGVHLFGLNDTINFDFLTKTNIEWVTLVPWGFQDDYFSPRIFHHNGDSLRIIKRDSSYLNRINLIHAAGLKVFMKPHVWINNPTKDTWRSDIYPENEENWALWKESYRDFILRYAKLAEESKVEMFCIGTEFSKLSTQKPTFWKALIIEIKSIYKGKLTYAANWYNEYEQISFWEELDYIGIQAYFPLTNKKYPSTNELSEGWHKFIPTLKSIHKKYNRKILFTELGYKSTADAGVQPWEWIENPYDSTITYSSLTQANCYEAFFKTIWPKEWFSGAHLWQWHTGYIGGHNGKQNRDFTPQGKPAEELIAKGFKMHQTNQAN